VSGAAAARAAVSGLEKFAARWEGPGKSTD